MVITGIAGSTSVTSLKAHRIFRFRGYAENSSCLDPLVMNNEDHEEYEDQAEKFSPVFFMIFVPFVVVKVFFDLFV